MNQNSNEQKQLTKPLDLKAWSSKRRSKKATLQKKKKNREQRSRAEGFEGCYISLCNNF